MFGQLVMLGDHRFRLVNECINIIGSVAAADYVRTSLGGKLGRNSREGSGGFVDAVAEERQRGFVEMHV